MSLRRVTFEQHLAYMLQHWRQGEHVLVCGPNSSGKTTLVRPLLDLRLRRPGGRVTALFTKLKDETISKEFAQYVRYTEWPRGGIPWDVKASMIWPKPGKTLAETSRIHRQVMGRALDAMARQGNRCVYFDETLYLTDPKYGNLGAAVGLYHYFARSSGISAVSTAQRPFWIPKVILSAVTHAYVARTRDKDDIRRLADLSSVDHRMIGAELSQLEDRHDFIYLNPQGDADPVIVNTRR